jgi:hypothetical protein
VKPTLRMMVLSSDQLEFSLMNFAWTEASASERKFLSSGHVCIQPIGSRPFKNYD